MDLNLKKYYLSEQKKAGPKATPGKKTSFSEKKDRSVHVDKNGDMDVNGIKVRTGDIVGYRQEI